MISKYYKIGGSQTGRPSQFGASESGRGFNIAGSKTPFFQFPVPEFAQSNPRLFRGSTSGASGDVMSPGVMFACEIKSMNKSLEIRC